MNVHLIRTVWPHWGQYSGVNQFVKYVNTERFTIREHLVADGDDDFPIKNVAFRSRLRGLLWKHSGMSWYKLSDLWAEMRAIPSVCSGHARVLHYLDADHTALFLPHLKHFSGISARLVASYHQPPDILASIIPSAVVHRLDCIIVVSPDQAAYFGGLVGPDRVRLILHGIDTDYFKPGHLPNRSAPLKCLTVGFWLRDFKALRAVANQLQGCRDIEFHVVTSQAEGLEGLTNVTIHRGIDDRQLLTLYQQSDILFLPLLQATANNSLLEGIACGLPVVSTLLPSVSTYLQGVTAELIPSNDPEQFAAAILRLAGSRSDRELMGRSARKRAEELDWRNIARQYEAVYSDVT